LQDGGPTGLVVRLHFKELEEAVDIAPIRSFLDRAVYNLKNYAADVLVVIFRWRATLFVG
jgi:hypothetical protein